MSPACSGDSLSDTKKIIVFVAGSLSQAFRKVAEGIQAEHGLIVDAEFGSTARMAKLIREGAPCDLFASADMETPQEFVHSGRAPHVVPFVRNDMVAVARKSLGVTGDNLRTFIAMTRPFSIGISDPGTQPCGANAIKALSGALSEARLSSAIRIITGGLDKKKEKAPGEKSDYAAALEKDVDLLVVFRTTAQKVCAQLDFAEIIELPPLMTVTAQYGMAALTGNSATHVFIDYLLTQKARHIFEEYGFK